MIAKVSSGQKLRIPAADYNAFVDAAEAYKSQSRQQQVDRNGVPLPPDVALVRNDSGADQDRFAILGLDAPLIGPDENLLGFQEHLTFSGISPDEDQHAHRFCVLQEPIAAGAIGRAVVAGVTPVQLDVQAADDDLAGVVTDETGSLKTGTEGGARILWKSSDTGVQWGLIAFPAGGTGGGSPNLVLEVAAANHGWMLGDVLHWDGAAWILADAGVVGATDMLGVVGKIPDADRALVVLWGICCLDGLTDHADYWLDPTIPGALTDTKPSDNARLVLHHAVNRLCVVRAGGAGSGSGGGAERFADLTDVDVTSAPPTDHQVPAWDATAQRWKPHDVVLADPVPANQILAGPKIGADAKPAFRAMVLEDLPQLQPCSVVANATSGALPPTALAALEDNRVLLRVGGMLQWLQLPTGALADGSVTDPKIVSLGWAKLTGVPSAFPPAYHEHPLGGDLSGTTDHAQLQPGVVGTSELADGSVTDAKVVSLAWSKLTGVPDIGGDHIHNLGGDLTGTTDDAQIAPGAVGTAELADGAVTNDKLENDFLRIGTTDWHLGDTVTGLMTNPMTGVGDLIVGGAAGVPTRLPANQGGTLQILTSKNNVTSLISHILDALEDVTIASPQDKQVLAYDAATSQWKNATAGPAAKNICLVGKITGKSSGNVYNITLYPEYPSVAVAWVASATQLQGDATKTIPANTWTLVCGNRRSTATGYGVADYDFFIQVPVWM
jgi:hypothetical protein